MPQVYPIPTQQQAQLRSQSPVPTRLVAKPSADSPAFCISEVLLLTLVDATLTSIRHLPAFWGPTANNSFGINKCSQPLTLIWPPPTGELNPLDATLTKNRGGVKAPPLARRSQDFRWSTSLKSIPPGQTGTDLALPTDELNPLDATLTKNGGR
jgi:hypothetical protein